MHFLRNGARSSPFGAALTAACVNFVVAAPVAADALLTANITVWVCGVSFFFFFDGILNCFGLW